MSNIVFYNDTITDECKCDRCSCIEECVNMTIKKTFLKYFTITSKVKICDRCLVDILKTFNPG